MTLIEPNAELAMFVLRLALGILFLAHGPQKFQDTGRKAASMGMNPSLLALVGVLETLGAASMILGVWTQLGAVFLSVVMLGTIYMKTQKWHTKFTGENGWELDFIVLAAALTVLLASPASYSLLP